MEDKWFFYMRHNKLFAHRSWTGNLIYVVEFDRENNVHKVTVNREPEQYNCVSVMEDEEHINGLLDWWVKPQYDYYHEWLSETYENLKKAGMITEEE